MKHTEETKKRMSESRKRYCQTQRYKIGVRIRMSEGKFPYWKGGRTTDGNYILVRAAGHPRASKNGKYVAEHILAMEKEIGRYLQPGEVVHHINEDKHDNRIENLELLTRSEHMKKHKPTIRGTMILCAECGKEKPMDSIKFKCCRWCYIKNHLGYAGKCVDCGEEKKFRDIKARRCAKCVIVLETGKPYRHPGCKGRH